MKVHVYGNVLNLGYITAKMLREKGVDAILFLDDASPHSQDYPWWDDPSLNENNLPDWVRYYKIFPFFLLPNKKTKIMIQDFSKCDVAFVSCFGPILAMKAKVPFVFMSAGSDLNLIDIKSDIKKVFLSANTFKGRIKKILKILTFSQLQKKAIVKHANKIIIGMGYQYKTYIEGYNIQHKTYRVNLPKDIKGYNKEEVDEELNSFYKEYKVVFFMISRHFWSSIWNTYKGNDKFLRAYAKFVKEFKPNTLLITAEKGIDVDKSKKIIESEGIQDYVHWVEDMPKFKLKKIQSLPNVVMVDNFWHDQYYKQYPKDKNNPKVGFGFGSVESLASKRPLLTAFRDPEFYNGEHPPIFEAFTEQEIYKQLIAIYDCSQDELIRKGKEGYEFAVKWYDNTSPNNMILDIIKDVHEENNINNL